MGLGDFRQTSATPITQGGVPVENPSTQFFNFSGTSARPAGGGAGVGRDGLTTRHANELFGPAFEHAVGERDAFLNFQEGVTDNIMDLFGGLTNRMGEIRSTMDPNAPWAEQMRGAALGQAEHGLRRSKSKIGKILGQQGIGAGSGAEASLMQRAYADMNTNLMGTEAEIGKSIADQGARLGAAEMGALTGLGAAGMQVLGSQEYPQIDALGFYESEQAQGFMDEAFTSWRDSMDATGQSMNPFYGTELEDLGNYMNYGVNTILPLFFGGTGLFD